MSARQEIDEIKGGKADLSFTLELVDRSYTEEDAVVIGSNSRYMFLYFPDDSVEIIPLAKIERFALN